MGLFSALGAAAGDGVELNNDDKKLFCGGSAGAGVVAGVLAVLAVCATGSIELVVTSMAGVNLKSFLLSFLRMSDKSVVSLRNEGLVDVGVVGVDLVICITGAVLTAGVVGAEAVFLDIVANEKESDRVLVGSPSMDKSSTGTTRSGLVPPTFDVVS
jgi:hypothetical protein